VIIRPPALAALPALPALPAACTACWAVLTAIAVTLGIGAASAAPAQAATVSATRSAPPRGGRSLGAFRVDVSLYPRVGVVLTVPAGERPLPPADFTVTVGGRAAIPAVRQLSPDDIELVLAPATDIPVAELRAERAAAALFLVRLPDGARTAAVRPAQPGVQKLDLTADPTASAAEMAALAGDQDRPPATRLASALNAFSAGARVRRTVVLVVSARASLAAAAAARFRRQLAASGTALYVLDASGRPSAYDALAVGSGGLAVRLATPDAWSAVFARITADLNEQYYLRFTDTAPLPGRVTVHVRTPAGQLASLVDLPVVNPVAPPPLRVSPIGPAGPSRQDHPLIWLAALLIVLGISYGVGMLAASRREPRRGAHRPRPRPMAARSAVAGQPAAADVSVPGSTSRDDLYFVFLMPCLNEEKVIMNSLRRLLSMPADNFVVLVIDDGSDDDTVGAISTALGDRVWLISRKAPHAREGKGEALNAAVRSLTGGDQLAGRNLDNVIIVVVDADGQLDPHAVAAVTPFFADPTIGAVQIGVRINNRGGSRLARMQDMEFVIYTEVFQRGRRHLGSVGLGGNGQFMRLSALQSLGAAPWTRSLTDDLDLGVRLLAAGWRNEYCSSAAVHQQGIIQLRRLIRQRSRWFQGHLQSWTLIPIVLRSAPRRARADLLYHLSSPAVLLIASLLSMSFVVSLANCVILAAQGRDPIGWWVVSTYALTFGPALTYSYVYWKREQDSGMRLLRVAGLAHLYVCYGMMWYAAGWWAVGRTLRGRTGWAKTDRVAEAPVGAPLPAAITASASQTQTLRPVVPVTASPAPVTASPAPVADPPAPVPGPATPAPEPATPAPEPATPAPEPATPAPEPATPAPEPAAKARPLRGRPRRAAAIALAAVITCAGSGAVVIRTGVLRRPGPDGWQAVFNGYGATSVTGSGRQQAITLLPGQTRARTVTHSALVISAARYRDFVATTQVQTERQLRQGAAGRPHPWEVGWVVWHYTSDQHFYALTLEPDGWVLSKQDPAYPGGERFLASGKTPVFRVGVTHSVRVVQIGDLITVSGDGHLLAQYTDRQRPRLNGAFGVYSEDSDVRFSHIRITALPAQP
jgi:1,2-diacylglycerol 3-beta-glucosyltransferase